MLNLGSWSFEEGGRRVDCATPLEWTVLHLSSSSPPPLLHLGHYTLRDCSLQARGCRSIAPPTHPCNRGRCLLQACCRPRCTKPPPLNAGWRHGNDGGGCRRLLRMPPAHASCSHASWLASFLGGRMESGRGLRLRLRARCSSARLEGSRHQRHGSSE